MLPYYAYLAAAGAFVENHCSGFGTNSTPNHLLIVGGQSPTLRNPPQSGAQPEWDMPSLPGHAQDHGLTWKVYAGSSGYPVNFYTQLKRSANIVGSDQIVADAKAGALPALAMVWHDSPYDEHPVADVSLGQGKVWPAVNAIASAGLWPRTVFLLTWDDWGGWDDHVATPDLEVTPAGAQLAYGPRVPLLMFGGPVRAGIDSRWNSHVSIGKTVLDLLGLPPLGVPRLDGAPSLADLVDTSLSNPLPPAFGTTISQTAPPSPTPPRHPCRPAIRRLRRGRAGAAARRHHAATPPTTSRFIHSAAQGHASAQRPQRVCRVAISALASWTSWPISGNKSVRLAVTDTATAAWLATSAGVGRSTWRRAQQIEAAARPAGNASRPKFGRRRNSGK